MRRLTVVVVSLVLLAVATASQAEEVFEAWRSPFGLVYSASATLGSCWVLDSLGLARVASDGTIAVRVYEPGGLGAVRANTADGSCWAKSADDVVHYGMDGAELKRLHGFPYPGGVDPTDGSWWGVDRDGEEVVHFSEEGVELWRGAFESPYGISVDPANGSCWLIAGFVGGTGWALIHLSRTGALLGNTELPFAPWAICADPRDGSCLIDQHSEDGLLVRMATDCTELWRRDVEGWPGIHYVVVDAIAVDPNDGSYWISSYGLSVWGYPDPQWYPVGRIILHLSVDGLELGRSGGWSGVTLSVDPADGTCWAARGLHGLMHLSPTGEVLTEGVSLSPEAVSVNASDGSCWVANGDRVAHIARTGEVLWLSIDSRYGFHGVSVDQSDGSCWIAFDSSVHHYAADGTELLGVGMNPMATSASSADGSCWVSTADAVIRLAADGSELARAPVSGVVSADAVDASCWVGTSDAIVHLASDGTELWRGPMVGIRSVSVNPTDGSCWVGTSSAAMHLAADGAKLLEADGINAVSVSVSAADGSCWVADAYAGQVVRIAADGRELWYGDFDWAATYSDEDPGRWSQLLAADPRNESCWAVDAAGADNAQLVCLVSGTAFPDLPFEHWAFDEIEACVRHSIVLGYPDGLYHPELAVTRDQMAVYVARALVSPSGDAAIPEPGPPPTFTDVLPDFWAYKQIEYAASQNVVEGYDDGTYQPALVVDRGQMAVYIARAMCAPSGDAAITDPEPPPTFPDVPETYWAFRHIEYCVANGVVSGYEDGLYRPEDAVTRDQMAVYIARAFGL